MSQTESPTSQGYVAAAKMLAGESTTDKVKSVCCIKTSCTADETQTSAGVTKSTESGLTLVDANTVATVSGTYANDTIQLDHKFTAGATATVKGFGVWSDDDDVLYAICCFAADANMESADTLTVQMKMQVKKAS